MSTASMSKPFLEMSFGEEAFFVFALVIFVCSMGFAFPKLLHSDEYVKKHG